MACQTWCRASNQQGSHPCKNSHPQPRLDLGPGWSTTVLGCRRVPCRKARLRYGRGEVRDVWRRSDRERRAPGLLCRRSVDRAQKQAHFPSTWRRGKEGTRGREKEPTPRVRSSEGGGRPTRRV
eukprot:scaffold10576_cov115-Isochrysis_galbana.AAC.10